MLIQLVACLSLALLANSLPINKERIRFKLSAKGLPDKDNIGTIDPYVQVFYTEGTSTSERKLGETDAIQDNENPEWSKIFEFDFDRSKNQQWHFLIWDKDHAREDDKGGQVWVDVNDYVDKGQLTNSNLDKQGYLTVQSADIRPQQQSSNLPGSLPYAPGSPATGTLTFRVSANGIRDKDNFGKTDPYVEIFYVNGLTGKPTSIGRTTTLSNTRNPQWGETFRFNWDRKKDQRLLFRIWDNDNFREDDKAGLAWVEVNDYVAKGQLMTVRLNKQGTLTIARADGLPVNPYNPALETNSPNFPSSPHRPQHFTNQPSSQFPSFDNRPHQNPSSQLPSYQPTQNQQQFPGQNPSSQLPSFSNQRGQTTHPGSPSKFQQPSRATSIRFKLAASNLPDKDLIGTSDPYVKVYLTQDGQPETLLKTGTKLSDNENPQWDDIYEFTYEPSRNPKLRFLILDQDDNVRDDELGNVSLDASELELRAYVILRLPAGSLTVQKL